MNGKEIMSMRSIKPFKIGKNYMGLFFLMSVALYGQKKDSIDSGIALEEVMVTAQKITQKAQKIPVAVTAIDGKKAQLLQLDNMNELGRITPNFTTYDDGGGILPVFAMRGIFTVEQTPTIGIYLDGVPIFDTNSITNILTNVKQIEITKGSQGVLYGRSALAGVINIKTKAPTNRFNAKTRLGHGNLNKKHVDVYLQNPLIKDKLFLGLTARYDKRDGYVFNDYLEKNLLNNDVISGGVNLRYVPNDRWQVLLRSNITKSQKNAYALLGGLGRTQAYMEKAKEEEPYTIEQDTQGVYDRIVNNNALGIRYTGDDFIFNSSTTFQYSHLDMKGEDLDWSPTDLGVLDVDYKPQNFGQELRVHSITNTPLHWLSGVFIHYIADDMKRTQHRGEALRPLLPSADKNLIPFAKITESRIRRFGIAAFGNLDYAFSERLKANLGLRYEYEFFGLNADRYYVKDGRTFTHEGSVELTQLTSDTYKTNIDFGALSGKTGFSYELNEHQLLWGSFGTGYRPGGVNQFAGSKEEATFYPEYSLTTEIGFKGTFWHQRLRTNLTAFYINYTDQQVYNVNSGDTLTSSKTNLGNSDSYGLEFESNLYLTRNIMMDFAIGYLQTNIYKFKARMGLPIKEVDYSGKQQPFSPTTNANAGLRYQLNIWDFDLDAYVDYQYRTKTYFDYANSLYQPAYGLLNAKINLQYKNYTLSVWSKNIMDKVYFSYGYSLEGRYNFTSYGLPRTYGVDLVVDF